MKLKIHFNHKEELWNSWSHAGGILLGVVFGAIFLYWCFTQHNGWATAGIILYLFGMLMSYIASTTYHAISAWSKWKERLRKWDHAAIYWHIAGSYSPITLIAMRDQGILGMEPFHLYLDLCHCRNHHEFRKTQGSQQLRNDLLCRNGLIRTRGFQAIARFGFTSHSYLDYRRGRLLHYGSRFLQHQQEAIYAFGIPFLCFGRKRLPHYRSLGYPHEIHLVFSGNISHQESLLYINYI